MRRLADAGLTTREACGNSVRNITACPYAGVAADERFDVTPYAEALTRFLLRHPLSSTLPRKFKIAFEGCPTDHIGTRRSTTSASARVLGPTAARGFRVTAGGGTAIMCTSAGGASRVPAGLGDLPRRRSRAARVPPPRRLPAQAAQPHEVPDQGARLDAVARGVRSRAVAMPAHAATCRRSSIDPPASEPRPDWTEDAGAAAGDIASRVARRASTGPGIMPDRRSGASGRATSVRDVARHQRASAETVRLLHGRSPRVPLGDLTSEQMRVLGELARAYGDGTIARDDRSGSRVPLGQRVATCGELCISRLAAAGLGLAEAATIADVDELPGRGVVPARRDAVARLGRLLEDHLRGAAGSDRAADGARASRSAAARTAAASITSRPSDSRAACAGSRAVPHAS